VTDDLPDSRSAALAISSADLAQLRIRLNVQTQIARPRVALSQALPETGCNRAPCELDRPRLPQDPLLARLLERCANLSEGHLVGIPDHQKRIVFSQHTTTSGDAIEIHAHGIRGHRCMGRPRSR